MHTPIRRITTILSACLVGTWQATQQSAREIAQWVASDPLTMDNVSTELADGSGNLRGTIEADGRVSGVMDDFVQKYVSQIQIGDKTINNVSTITISGSLRGRYSASGSKLTVWAVCTENFAHATVEMDGKVISDMDINLQEIADGGPIPGMAPRSYNLGGPKPTLMGLAATQTEIPSIMGLRLQVPRRFAGDRPARRAGAAKRR